jgi:4-diphosphocytidyl-2-C-methyl-D-erythritol kinase
MTERLDRAHGRWEGTAPAKVNLFLRVLAREDSGFHQLETLFQTLELADGVVIERRDGAPGHRTHGDVALEVTGIGADALGPPEKNLAVRAARVFLEAVEGAGGAFHIRLEKRIPHGAGLGGGSSDAAAVLSGMNALHGSPLAPDVLARLGATLGADVAFFLCGSPLALAWGRGDRLLPLPPLPSRPVLLVIPEEGISTPWAYQVLAAHRAEEAQFICAGAQLHAGGIERWSRWSGVREDQENAFEAALHPHRPELEQVRRALEGAGALVARLSGSGAAVFGVFADEAGVDAAKRAIEALSSGQGGPRLRLIETRTG